MPDKQPVLFTFHKIREQCEQGDGDSWRAFLNFYGPLWLGLLTLYLPGDAETHPRVLEKLLTKLSANDFEGFRATARQSEREFLTDVRAMLLDIAEGFAAPIATTPAGDGPAIDLAKVG